MRRVGKFITVACVNVVLLLLLLELAGLGVFLVKEGHLFYGRSSLDQPQPEAIDTRASTNFVLHPVMGFIRRPAVPVTDLITRGRLNRMLGPGKTPPWISWSTNNFGFFSNHDYPHTPPDNPYLIGVFGGSVAQWFALQGAPALIERLRQVPGLEGRRIEILNFAQGAFKQPQQMQVLAYFLTRGQPLDFVLNIDGFNDVALSLLNVENHIDPSLPSSQQLLPLMALLDRTALRLELLEAYARARRNERRLKALEARMAGAWSAGVWLVLEVFRQRATQRYRTASMQLDAGVQKASHDLIYLNPWPDPGDSEAAFGLITSIWMRASSLMDSMLRARGVPYLHVIQPNQYFSKKPFSDEERRRAINVNSRYAKGAMLGYPYLLKHLPAMRSQGIDVVSAVDLFDETPQIVYADNCCHFNQFGNEVLARFIAGHMAHIISSQDRPAAGRSPEE